MDDAVLRTHYEDCWLVCHDCAIAKVKRLQAGVEQLRRELHDERVRRDEWEKMYNQAAAGTEVEQPRERPGYWMHVDLNVAQTERSKQLAEVERLLKMALDNEVDSRVRAELEDEQLQADLERQRRLLHAERIRHEECDAVIAHFMRQVRAACEQAGLGKDHALHDYVPLLGGKIAILTREVRRLRTELAQTLDRSDEVETEFYLTRDAAQEMSDEVRELWLSPCEAEGLKRQLAKAEALAALVTPELAELLNRLADTIHGTSYSAAGVASSTARALAAHIREALGETE